MLRQDRSALQNPLATLRSRSGVWVQRCRAPRPDGPDVNPKLVCDRLLLMYDTAVASSPDAGAAFIRTLQGDSGH